MTYFEFILERVFIWFLWLIEIVSGEVWSNFVVAILLFYPKWVAIHSQAMPKIMLRDSQQLRVPTSRSTLRTNSIWEHFEILWWKIAIPLGLFMFKFEPRLSKELSFLQNFRYLSQFVRITSTLWILAMWIFSWFIFETSYGPRSCLMSGQSWQAYETFLS